MPDYAYNLVYRLNDRRVVEEHLTPHAFAGTPEEFGMAMLLDLIARTPAAGDIFAGVNVWHSDREGVGVPGPYTVRVSTLDLDAGPFPANQLEIDHYTYYVASGDHDITTDDVLGGYGTDVRYTEPQGLVVPGSGPALKIRTGHQYGYIALDVRVLESGPAADLAAWEAVEQATITPQAEVQIYTDQLAAQDQFPDLTGGRRVEYLTIRVSARGRDAKAVHSPRVHPRRVPLEHHLIEAWPASARSARGSQTRSDDTLLGKQHCQLTAAVRPCPAE
jgi:hypothetical protein